MIRFLGKLPRKCVVAFSGGVDSVAVTDFLLNGKRDVHLAFFHHGTATSDEAEAFAKEFSKERNLTLSIGRISCEKPPGESMEEYWRNERYRFLSMYEFPVITAHHLGDAVETWIFNSLHGNPRVLPYQRNNIIRPFLITPKSELIDWAEKKGLKWVEDKSNNDLKYMRNLIRHKIVPEAMVINPGLDKVVKKMYIKDEKKEAINHGNV
jgi:tRNA(Ile)-lysidine synthase